MTTYTCQNCKTTWNATRQEFDDVGTGDAPVQVTSVSCFNCGNGADGVTIS